MKSSKALWIGVSALAASLLCAPPILAQAPSPGTTPSDNGATAQPNNSSSTAQPSNNGNESTTESAKRAAEKAKEAAENAGSAAESGAKKAYHKVSRGVSDAMLKSKVKSVLYENRDTKNESITVSAHKGVVKLTGRVKSRASAQEANEIVARLDGVNKVKNELRYPGMHNHKAPSMSRPSSSSGTSAKPPYSPSAPAEKPSGQ